ncbi:hypothetical protein PoB_001274600 [Plakobranchus ocellatus]|uniref:Uncharacterized protein n=1 Tax=Plakobranchus ocellatus TaxID=259542 RepID=A0AAV3YFZ4_9GAST|nr:hypothetical protein PoB_001274600 [Plakobranchus ocellatus]
MVTVVVATPVKAAVFSSGGSSSSGIPIRSCSNSSSSGSDNGCSFCVIFLIVGVTPQQGDLRLLGHPSGQGAGSGARTRDRRAPAYLRADSLTTVPSTPTSQQEAFRIPHSHNNKQVFFLDPCRVHQRAIKFMSALCDKTLVYLPLSTKYNGLL